MTKKIIALLLAVMMLVSMSAVSCTPDDGGDKSESSSNKPAASDTPKESESESTPDSEPESETESETEAETEPEPEPVKSDFEIYHSNTPSPTGANYLLKAPGNEPVTGTFRGVFAVQEYGEFDYKLYFSNNVDSTWGGGGESYRNIPTKGYKIISAVLGTTTNRRGTADIQNPVKLTFDGNESREVVAGEMFWSDAVKVNVKEGEYLVFEWTVEYLAIACTQAEGTVTILAPHPTLGKMMATAAAPMPALIGCNRESKLRIGFIGDSITMGVGASGQGWATKISEKLGPDYSTWNMALGYARGNDAVNSTAWLEKAKNNDVLVICFGVNDINSGAYIHGPRKADEVLGDIATIAKTCADAGCEIIIFSTPPYTYATADRVETWSKLTVKLKELAEKENYKFFDFASYLGKADDPSTPAYGGHPNAEGCEIVAKAFVESGLIKVD